MSPGLLLLLMVSSCLPLFNTQPANSGDERATNQDSDDDPLNYCKNYLKKNYRGNIQAAINILEGFGCSRTAALLKVVLMALPQEDKLSLVKSGLKELQVKFDNLRAEMRWDAWAAGAYHVPVNNIEKAWDKYTELVQGSQQKTNNEKNFYTYYSQFADSTSVLHQYLTAKPDSAMQNLGDVLAAKLKCHEKDVKAQFLYFNQLMYRGNMLNTKYHQFKGTNTKARVDAANEMASQSASALFTSHQRCISDSAPYIGRDIFERIDDSKKHQDIANDIMVFLEKTYDRYEWMVVAFSTENSKHIPRWMKRHVLSGFTEVARGDVTVAVAKQVKGGDTKTDDVKNAIKKCLPEKSLICLNIHKNIRTCQEEVFGKSLSQTITAIHTYKAKSQTSSSAVKVPEDQTSNEESELTESTISSKGHHLYMGECGKVLGKFIIFIKSDEEIMGVDPCSEVDCGQNGKCVVVPRTSIGLCKCQYPYYGDRCEMSLETYRTVRRRSRSKSPARHRLRSKSRARSRSRSKSRERRRSRSKSPKRSARRRSRSKSPARRRSRSKSPARRRSRSKSPARRRSRSKSPARRRSRSKSPARRRSRSKSPARRRSRSKSPARRRSRSKSPARRRSQSESPKGSGSELVANARDHVGGALELMG